MHPENDQKILDMVKNPENWTYLDPNDGYQGGGWNPIWSFRGTKQLKDLAGISIEMLPRENK